MNPINSSKGQARKRRLTRHEVAELLACYPGAGLNQREFAEKEGVPLSSLQYWLRQARNGAARPERPATVSKKSVRRPAPSSGPAGFIEVNLEGRVGGATPPVRYEIRHGEWMVTVPEGFSRESLSILLESIRGQ